MLESSYFENISLFLISIYSIFIVFWLTVADLISIDELILSRIDTVFLTLFIIEIFMKSFASNLNYLKDVFNLFDAIIVVISFSLNCPLYLVPSFHTNSPLPCSRPCRISPV